MTFVEKIRARLLQKDASTLVSWCLGGVLIVTALVYARCLGNDFVFDDLEEIVYNPYIGHWSFVTKSLFSDPWWFRDPQHQSRYYRPLMNVWQATNYHLFGLNPAGWHAAMIALHLLVVWLAYRLAVRLSGDRRTGVLAAALFALMPLHAETVVWPAAIAPLMCAAFELPALDYYVRAANAPLGDPKRTRWQAASLALFGGALLSYDSAIAFPGLIAAYAWIFPSPALFAGEGNHERNRTIARAEGTFAASARGRAGEGAGWPAATRIRAMVIATWPYALEFAAYLGVRLWALGFIFKPHIQNHMTIAQVALTIPGALWGYAMILLIPWIAGPAHRLNTVTSIASRGFYLPLIGVAALCAAAYALLRNHPRRRLYLYYAAFVLVAIGPLMNLLAFKDQLALQDRYVYFPAFGFCLFAADLAADFMSRGGVIAAAARIGAAAAVVVYAVVLYHVEHYWHDGLTLFSECVAEAPDAGTWHSRLGLILEARGEYRAAQHQLEIADRIDPYTQGVVLHDLSLIDEHLGDPRAAAKVMAQAVARLANPPAVAYTDLAIARDAAGDTAGANAALARAAALPGGAEVADLARAQLQLLHGDPKGAEAAVRNLLKRDPNYVAALNVLGAVLTAENRNDEALAAYRRAAAIVPADSGLHYRIAMLLHKLGRNREARIECTRALEGAPRDPKMLALMAAIERSGVK
ncbi:MAG: tetratricopeptide repeat protein [Candidatus Binataceae bacterium]